MDEKKIKVLVADDDDEFRELMKSWLQSKGYAVITANDGSSAVKITKEEKPDIIFMDLRMPLMDGAEAIKRIRKFNKKVPIIVISAYVDEPQANKASAYGISGIFYKEKGFSEGLSLLEAALRTLKHLK